MKWLLLLLLHLTTQVHWHVALGLKDRKIHFKPIQISFTLSVELSIEKAHAPALFRLTQGTVRSL